MKCSIINLCRLSSGHKPAALELPMEIIRLFIELLKVFVALHDELI